MLNRAISAIRSFVPFVPEDSITPFADIEGHVTRGLLRRGDGALVAMWRVEGRPFEVAEDAEYYARRFAINSVLVNQQSERLIIGMHDVRGPADPSLYPRGPLRSTFARELDERYREQLTAANGKAPLYWNETYFSLTLRPFMPLGERAHKWLPLSAAVPEEPIEEAIRTIEDAAATFETSLRPYGLKRLRTRLAHRTLFSEIAEALVLILTGERRDVAIPDGPLGEALYPDRVRFGVRPGFIQIDGPGGERFATVLRFKRPPNPCPPGIFDGLRQAQFFYSLSRFFHYLDNADADKRFQNKHNRMATADDPAKKQMKLLGHARERLMARDFVMGNSQVVMTAFADTERALEVIAPEAARLLGQYGAQATRAGLEDMAAYWSHLPGNVQFWPSPMPITSMNFAAMTLPHSYPIGPEKGRWGGAVTLYRSSGGTPLRFHLHVRDVANIAVFGPSGGGKTTWLMHLFAQAEKTGAKIVFFDQFRGADLGIRALDGIYSVSQDGVPTGFNPVKALSSSSHDLTYLRETVAGLILADGGRRLDTEEYRAIGTAVRLVMELPRRDRSLGEVRAFLGHKKDGPGPRLEPWCRGNELGWALDCDDDVLDLNAMLVGHDTTGLSKSRARGPIYGYLAHRTQSALGKGRAIVAFDEFHAWIEDDYWAKFPISLARTIRRRNGGLMMLTQHPGDIVRSKFGHTLMQQTRQWIFFADPNATKADYLDGVQISEVMFDIIKRRLMAGEFLWVRDGEAMVGQLALGGMDDVLTILSSRDENVARAEKIRARVGDKPDDWIPELLKEEYVA